MAKEEISLFNAADMGRLGNNDSDRSVWRENDNVDEMNDDTEAKGLPSIHPEATKMTSPLFFF